MPTALDNGRRSPRKLLRAVVARLLGRTTGRTFAVWAAGGLPVAVDCLTVLEDCTCLNYFESRRGSTASFLVRDGREIIGVSGLVDRLMRQNRGKACVGLSPLSIAFKTHVST